MTEEQRLRNLQIIARGSWIVQERYGVPASLCASQCILESGWLQSMSGKNNPFGIKARAGEPGTDVTTTEFLTPKQLASVRAQGKKILSVEALENDKHKVVMIDRFADYESLDDAFLEYGKKFETNKYFRPRLEKYRTHRSLETLVDDMTGADGLPPYATDPNYAKKILDLAGSTRVVAALAGARDVLVAEGKITEMGEGTSA